LVEKAEKQIKEFQNPRAQRMVNAEGDPRGKRKRQEGAKMKLVRARPKRVEDLPAWAKCCPAFGAAYQRIGEITVNLDETDEAVMRCWYCKRPHGILKGVLDVGDQSYLALECLDLDEGEYSGVNQ
jgi:hypothetical protein